MLSLRRTVKKTTYALVFLSIIFVVLAVFIVPRLPFLHRSTGPGQLVQPESVVIESIDTVSHDDSVDIVARVRNPNPRAGIPEYTIIFVLYDEAGRELNRIKETTYLLPGSLNYLAQLEIVTSSPVARVAIETPEQPVFAAVPVSISPPTFNSFLRGRTTRPLGDKQVEIQKGIVTNTGALSWRHVDITGVAFDAEDKVVGIGKTFIGEFNVGQQREFTIEWPAPTTPTQRVIVLPATNVFKEDNILNVTGDPGLLR
ncbi:MAG: hypothetical protein ABIH36_00280 [bacterium]